VRDLGVNILEEAAENPKKERAAMVGKNKAARRFARRLTRND
jgi:hypothetical protein